MKPTYPPMPYRGPPWFRYYRRLRRDSSGLGYFVTHRPFVVWLSRTTFSLRIFGYGFKATAKRLDPYWDRRDEDGSRTADFFWPCLDIGGLWVALLTL